MTWTLSVTCSRCGGRSWKVRGGTWTCECGKHMTLAEVKAYHDGELNR
ncbi:hypothetical protein SEA_PIPER2020_79 [Mycobacterium phage Piper2020]|nr:hypothetical protein SEA_PIPER2020_79 [Mycobacterium phage Piper2020]